MPQEYSKAQIIECRLAIFQALWQTHHLELRDGVSPSLKRSPGAGVQYWFPQP
jgi:hypothetical protein